jgi:hypothetical protein
MKTKIMGALAILIIALSIAGIVYAHWTDSVLIKGTAQMGSITFGFTSIIDEWDSEWYYGYPPDKCCATTNCYLKQPVEDSHTHETVYKVLQFNMTGGYGDYWGINKFTVDNAGTVPIKIQNITLILPVGFHYVKFNSVGWDVYNATNALMYEIWLYNETNDVEFVRSWYGDPGCPPWALEWYLDDYGLAPLGSINGSQIDKLGEIYTEMCVWLPEGVQKCHTYTFTIALDAVQWNKWVP